MTADGVYKPTPEEQFMQQKSLLIKLEKQKDEVDGNTIFLVLIFLITDKQRKCIFLGILPNLFSFNKPEHVECIKLFISMPEKPNLRIVLRIMLAFPASKNRVANGCFYS